MDLQTFLALSAASVSAVVIGQMVITETYRVPGSAMAFALHALVILLAVAGFWLFPGFYGYLAAVALLAIYAPGLLMQRAGRALQAGRYDRAARLARLAFILHPSADLRFNAGLATALSRASVDERVVSLQNLRREAPPAFAPLIDLHILRQHQDWAGMIDFMRATRLPATADSIIFPVRALGETGQLDAMMQAFSANRATLGSTLMPSLVCLAFCGRIEGVEACLSSLSALTADMRAFWRATVLQAAGRNDDARALLEATDTASIPDAQREAIEARLRRPVAEAALLLSPLALRYAEALEDRVGRDAQFRRAGWRRTPLTYLLLAANLAMFAVEAFEGDTTANENLFNLGALWPEAVTKDHEWWRLVSAMFLHAGPEHLISNMLALWVLGRFIELSFGTWRMGVIYAVGGLASMLGVLALMVTGVTEPDILVGASGAIFALFGALAWQRFTDFRISRTLADRRNLTMIGLVLVLEAAIDLSFPQISFSAHGVGLLAGLVLGWALKR